MNVQDSFGTKAWSGRNTNPAPLGITAALWVPLVVHTRLNQPSATLTVSLKKTAMAASSATFVSPSDGSVPSTVGAAPAAIAGATRPNDNRAATNRPAAAARRSVRWGCILFRPPSKRFPGKVYHPSNCIP